MNAKIRWVQALCLMAGSSWLMGAEDAVTNRTPASSSVVRREVQGSGVVQPEKINVRGQPTLKSEVVTQLTKGDTVDLLEEITLSHAKGEEPAKWFRILLPTNTPVWVSSAFIDPTNKTVLPKKLNLRSGPGENFSVLGTLEKGSEIKEIRTKENWIEIFAPSNAYAFLAADLVKTDLAPAPVTHSAATTETLPIPVKTSEETPAVPTPKTTLATPPVEIEKITPEPPPADTTANVTPPMDKNSPVQAVPPPRKRIVTREGIVKPTRSIQAPTYFELENKETGKTINYLLPRNPEMKLKPYQGARVIVVGEEYLDERWPKTPVLEIESIALP